MQHQSNSQTLCDPEKIRIKDDCKSLCQQYNCTYESEYEKRESIFNQLFSYHGKNLSIRPPFRCEFGKNIFLGDNVVMNFDCVIEDTANVTIGDNTLLAPRVKIFCSSRENKIDGNRNIEIGENVWIGGGVTIHSGVFIGNNVTIGAGSVVLNDIPSDCVAVGNPCKVIRCLEK